MFRDDEPVTKELRDYRRRLLILLPIFSVVLFIPVFLFMYYGPDIPEEPLLGIINLYEALRLSCTWLWCAFGTMVLATVVGTWINIRRSNLKHAIVEKVNKGMGVGINYYDPNCTDMSKFCQADDEKLIMQIIVPLNGFIIPGAIFIVALSILLYHIWDNNVTVYDGVWIIASILLLLYLIYNLCFPRRRIEFNRLEGTVTVPAFFFPCHRTLKFDKVQINAYEKKFQLVVPYRFLNLTLVGNYDQAQQWWSFYMWYMDKNRPLPVGTLLDAYREKDYLRRRSEGFPEALYPATIDTPEWKEAEEKYSDNDAKNRYRIK